MRLPFISLAFLLPHIATLGQPLVEAVGSKSVSSNESKSYLYSNEVRLLPGFVHNAQTNGVFFCRPANYGNQPISLDRNFVRIETAILGTSSDGVFSAYPVGQKSVEYVYYDDAGRHAQTVNLKASPTSRDVVSFSDYNTDGWQTRLYLPYASQTSNLGSFATNLISRQADFYSSTVKVNTDTRPFVEHTAIEKSPLGRIKESFGPGADWFNAARKNTNLFEVNSASKPVKRWQISESTGLPISTDDYPPGSIAISKSVSEEGIEYYTMTDFRSNEVQSTSFASPALTTYKVYDDFGRVRFVIPPSAASNLNPDQAFADRWYFQYSYDARGRLIKEKGPGTDWVFYVYDQWDRLVASQDGVQRGKSPKEWVYIKYDHLNRPIMTGKFTSSNTHEEMISSAMAVTGRFEDRDASVTGYTLSNSFPKQTGGDGTYGNVTEANLFTVSYYDDYYFLGLAGWDAQANNFSFQNPSGFSEPVFTTVKGQQTGAKIRVLGQSTWLNSVVYYDSRYRPIQSINEHHLGGTDRVTSAYNYAGWTLKTMREHGSSSPTSILEEFEYDHAGRLLKHFHKIGTQPRVVLAAYAYNEAGQIVEKNIHSSNEGASYLQSVDFRYNIRGWLTSINNSTLTNDGNLNDDTNDLFGMQLVFQEAHPPANGNSVNPRYDGMPSAIKWKTNNLKTAPKERLYAFYYDGKQRLQNAWFAANNGAAWTGEPGLYDEDNLTYDENGNILSLRRFAKIDGARAALDNLSYNYGATQGNKTETVEDVGNASLGFVNGANGQVTEYSFDANGNLTSDLNSALTSVTYNHLNLPEIVTYNGGTASQTSVEMLYDATGYLLKKTYKRASVTEQVTDYVQGIHFRDGVQSVIYTPDGRATPWNGSWEYEYTITDHLGNTRVRFGFLHEAFAYRATMEPSLGTAEGATFTKIAATRENNITYNRTPRNTELPNPQHSAWLNGGIAGREIGPGKMLTVTAGDKIKMEARARYLQPSGSASDIVGSLVGLVTSSFGIVQAENPTAYAGFNNYLPGATNAITANSGEPKAYLSYIIFNSTYTSYQFGHQSVNASAAAGHQRLALDITVPYNGYCYIYLTNESNYHTYFDEFLIIHEKNSQALRVTEAADYYPFGLAIEGTRYVDLAALYNNYGYQGLYSEFDPRTGWNRFELRGNYDSRLGRWHSPDPYGQYGSPFIGMGNNPVNGVDSDGGFVNFIIQGAFSGAMMYYANNASNFSWRGFFRAAAVGAGMSVMSNVLGGVVSSELYSSGVDAGTSMFVGGLIGNVSAGLVAGGGGNGIDGFGVLAASSAFAAVAYSNPAIKRDVSEQAYADRVVRGGWSTLLPEVEITALREGNWPAWWGNHNLAKSFSNPIANAVRAGRAAWAPFAMTLATAPLSWMRFGGGGGYLAVTGTRTANALKFGGDEAVAHFNAHADQIMKVTGKSAYNLKNYVDDANWIIKNGTYSSKLNGYYHYMGNAAKGESLFGFVGLKNGGSTISTFHIKTATQLGLK